MLSLDMNKTKEVDLLLLNMDRTIQSAKFVLEYDKSTDEEKKEAQQMIDDIEKKKAEYKPPDDVPAVIIGYIPAKKLSEIKHQQYDASRSKEINAVYLDKIADLTREVVRWGIRNHVNMDPQFTSEKAMCGSREHQVASWEMVDIYEHLGLLEVLSRSIMEYNTLSESKKKLSLFLPGQKSQ